MSSRECLGCVLHGLEEDGEDIPAPTPLTQIKTKGYERADQLANLRSCSISIQDNAPLFMNRTEQLFMAWKRYCAANGMSPVNLYELRHTFVSLAKRLPEGLV